MTEEACKDAEEFYERLTKMEMGKFTSHIQKFVTTEIPTESSLSMLVPYSPLCWMPVARTDLASEDVHVYQRRATRCRSCTEYSEIFIWCDNNPSFLLGCLSGELGFSSKFVRGWTVRFWMDGTHVASPTPVLHDVITRTSLVGTLPSVIPPFYAFGCADRGLVVEWMPEHIEELVQPWNDMQTWLNALEKIKGFIVAPSETMFDKTGRIKDLSTLCWTHPSNPRVRWMSPMRMFPARMQVSEGGVDRSELKGMRSWRRWFYEAVHGEVPTLLPRHKEMTVRRWNTWMTWTSLALCAWPEGQIQFLAPVMPKEPLRNTESCFSFLMDT